MIRKTLLAAALALAALTTSACAVEMDWAALQAQAVVTPPARPVSKPVATPAAAPAPIVVQAAPVPVQVTVAAPEKPTNLIPYGDSAIEAFHILWAAFASTLLGLVLTFLAKNFPFAWGLVKMYGTEKLANQLHDAALNAVQGACKGKVLSLHIASPVLETAVQMAVDDFPKLIRWMGGPDGIRKAIFAVMHLDPSISAADLAVQAPSQVDPTPAPAEAPVPSTSPASVAPAVSYTVASAVAA